MKKIFSLFLAFLIMLLPVSTVFADSADEKINISVKKYMYVGEELKDVVINDGTKIDIKDSRLAVYDKNNYGRVAFSLYKIEDLTLVPENKSAQDVAFDVQDAVLNNKNLPYGATLVKENVDVDENGEALFTGIENNKGYGYILIETISSALVKQIANPMFISLPMMNPDGSGYLKGTVFLYPKNNVKLLELDFNKLQQGNTDKEAKALEGAKFKLYIGEPGKGKVVKESSSSDKDLILTTDKDGKFLIPGLMSCKFYLVEQEVDGLVDKNAKLLISGDARNDEYNKLFFEVDDRGKIKTSDEFINYTNYTKPEIEKKIVSINDSNSYNTYENIDFEVKMSIPRNAGEYSKLYIEDKLMLNDKATEDAKYVDNSFVVTADGKALDEGKDYTLSKTDNTFKINFIVNDKVSNRVSASTELLIKYSANFLPTVKPGEKYENKASITYNNSPHGNNEDRTEHTDKKVEFTSYGFTVRKTNDGLWKSNISPEGLEGAKFILLDKDSNVYKGPKEVMFASKGSDDFILTSDKDGFIKVTGLKAGTYILKEIEAPKGFELPTGKESETEIKVSSESHLDKNIVNIKNVRKEFVMTGREEALTTAIGLSAALFALIGIYAVISRKKRKNVI